ncbi:hypothetical protein HanRHA438_Chr03g0149611 [Helianthus annuus]|uniref:Uncharacterized protein n=1 Tax=Helianthus annuus TaxID=4232 RepID=A0A251VCV1_HELAN|nr:hypothetical protein HanXRQr2_Chr03g0138151 [Helianthus annuus]KAJ0603360.1 hypothetical protein HanIR_Chr03g0149651 [Helianthus annuus]KAJ0938135.1 hypothetical protein HanRHA438_Chr03g0149611 [Helianthus annuus]KAJ0946033.1 hypothetical protein HanPSC8_Chr03g0134721 [Helianthus annuus]
MGLFLAKGTLNLDRNRGSPASLIGWVMMVGLRWWVGGDGGGERRLWWWKVVVETGGYFRRGRLTSPAFRT